MAANGADAAASAAAQEAEDLQAGGKKAKVVGQARFGDEQYASWVPPTVSEHLKKFADPSKMADQYHPKYVEAVWDKYWDAHGLYSAENDEQRAARIAAEGPQPEDLEQDEAKERPEPFVIVLPPPNVTGDLHLGHALTCAIQDTLVRWNRMRGAETLWVPGTDHAGIATQSVVERRLMKERGIDRHQLGREAFLKEVWAFKETREDNIKRQMRRIGASLDWSRERFTLDDQCQRAVMEAFKRLFNQGLIFRENRLVNWSCALQTAISEVEVDKVELKEETAVRVPGHKHPVMFGAMHYFRYPVRDPHPEGPTHVTIATTRVETMLGDVAVAINSQNPDAERLKGRSLLHPYFPDRDLPIVIDDDLVELGKGTGCVKITPAHDPNDFECGRRHNLPVINIFDESGRILQGLGTPFDGMGRFDARHEIIWELLEKGLYVDWEAYPMQLRVCSRSKDVIEPALRPQWWVETETMAKHALQASIDGKLNIIPDLGREDWARWLSEIQSWCISRQLWWGHQIPAWTPVLGQDADQALQQLGDHQRAQAFKIQVPSAAVQAIAALDEADTQRWVVGTDAQDAQKIAQTRWPTDGVAEADLTWVAFVRDSDVLDTWFSSALWPFSVMGWPEKTPDMDKFFPGSLLETGKDILFFWVARMVFMSQSLVKPEGQGIEEPGPLPFHTVYLHSMVRDKDGKKMSKATGNVIDPIDVIDGISLEGLHERLRTGNLDPRELERGLENQKVMFPNGISECGADALRFGLMSYAAAGSEIKLDILRVVGYRQFCNKLWNIVRFALAGFPADWKRPKAAPYAGQAPAQAGASLLDRWILHRVTDAVAQVNRCLRDYEFARCTEILYHLWLNDISQVYVECLKPVLRGEDQAAAAQARETLFWVIDTCLRLLHPLMPFVTEELYHWLPDQPEFVRSQGGVTREAAAKVDPEASANAPSKVSKRQLGSIMVARYPEPEHLQNYVDADAEGLMDAVREIAAAGRSSVIGLGLNPRKVQLLVGIREAGLRSLLAQPSQVSLLVSQLGVEKVTVMDPEADAAWTAAASDGSHHRVALRADDFQLLVPLAEQDPVAEALKLERQATRKIVAILTSRQSCPAEDCPEKLRPVREQALARIQAAETELAVIQDSLAKFRARMKSPQQAQDYTKAAEADIRKEMAGHQAKADKLRAKKVDAKAQLKIDGFEEIIAAVQKQLDGILAVAAAFD